MRRYTLAAGVMTLTLALIGPMGEGSAWAAFPGDDGLIAYTGGTHFNERARVYTIGSDGSGRAAVTPQNRYSFAPAWSADGASIAFVRYGQSGYALLTAAADGSHVHIVVPASTFLALYSPAWSPDGASLAFSAYSHGRHAVYTVSANGSGLTKITLGTHDDSHPSWSPDGNTIAVDTTLSSRATRIVTMATDGTGRTPVVATGYNADPDWSPDGSHLVFERLGFARFDIFTVKADGTELTNLTGSRRRDETTPVYSPSGTWIAYARTQSRFTLNEDLWYRRADGTGIPHRVTDTPRLDEYFPSWQPT